MLRAGLALINPSALSAAAALPALQLLRGGAVQQQCCFATKAKKAAAAPYVEDAKKSKAKKKEVKAAAPKAAAKEGTKRAPSAFNMYVKAHASSISSGTAADRMKRMSQEWKTLSDADKAPYLQQAAAAKAETAKVGDDCACSTWVPVHAWHTQAEPC